MILWQLSEIRRGFRDYSRRPNCHIDLTRNNPHDRDLLYDNNGRYLRVVV